MSTLADREILNTCLVRLSRLGPAAKRRWGKMTAHEMVCHLNDSFDVGSGAKYASSATGIFQRSVMKFFALHSPMPWPHGVPTRPEIEQGHGGTPPIEWEKDCSELRRRMVEFAAISKFGVHPIFGSMNRADWLIWGYRHVDHHFRQFDV